LEGLVDDLPEVDITALTAGETCVQSAKEQVKKRIFFKYFLKFLVIYFGPNASQ
jgi:hypothetical protein